MSFVDSLPDTVTVDGKDYSIYSDFRDWIRFDCLMRDDSISPIDRAALMLEWYKDTPPITSEAFEALINFYQCDDKPTSNSKKNVFDLGQDMQMIYAGFIQSYNINLIASDYLHWWAFRALLDSLPDDTKLSKVIGYRSLDLSKVPKEERARYRELQRIYSLEASNNQHTAPTLEDRDRELLKRAEDARRRTESN